MTTRLCAHCGHPFEPRPQVPDQAFCSAPECQRARKRDWQRAKLQSDPDYRINQQAAQRAWSQRNHDYWRNHRDAQQVNGDQGEQPTTAPRQQVIDPVKMDVSTLPSGIYPPMATPNCSTYGHPNCSRQDGRMVTIRA